MIQKGENAMPAYQLLQAQSKPEFQVVPEPPSRPGQVAIKVGAPDSSGGNQLRAALIDSVTHEFRTPLTAIKVAASALLAGQRMRRSQLDELLSIINEEADRLNRLVGDAVAATRLDADVKLDLEPQTVKAIVSVARSECRSMLADRVVSVQLASRLPPVWADLQRTKKVLAELLQNAAKYSSHDKPITVTAVLSRGSVVISVSDRGNGIVESERDMIFKRFYRGKEHRGTVHGTGMGLYIAKAIVEAHGGSLTVSSRRGCGSTFSFTLRICKETLLDSTDTA
jgi:two-component system, OmpR family, sensor histidine kinase KdpD